MRRLLLLIALLLVPGLAWADGSSYVGTCQSIAWTANTEWDLAGYRLYDRVSLADQPTMIRQVGVQITSIPCADLGFNPGQHYVSVTAFDLSGNESARSAEIPFVIVSVGTVNDLRITSVGGTSLTMAYTEIDDGTGQPANMAFRFATPTMSWGSGTDVSSGTCATPVTGTSIGATKSCTITGLSTTTAYQVQAVPFRGTLNQDAVFLALTNVVGATTGSGGLQESRLTLAQDSFTRADENPLGNSVWTGSYSGLQNCKLVSNAARGILAGTGHCLMSYTGITWPDDQWVQATLSTFTGGSSGIEISCRVAASTTNTRYHVAVYGSGPYRYELRKVVAGSSTVRAQFDSSTVASSDIIRLECTGSTTTKVALYQNGNYLGAFYDTTSPITSGKAGIGAYVAGAEANTVLDNWSAGSFSYRTILISDTFDRSDSADLGTAWDDGYVENDGRLYKNAVIVGNAIRPAYNTTFQSAETYNAVALPDDQWISGTMKTVNAPSPAHADIWLTLRTSGHGPYAGYSAAAIKGAGFVTTWIIKKSATAAQVILAQENATTWAASDELLFTAVGCDLKVYRNKVLLLAATDCEYSGGRPGVGFYAYVNDPANMEIETIQAGGFASTPTVTRTLVASDNFNRANNADLGASWDVTTGSTACQIVSNQIRSTTASQTCLETYNATPVSPDQYSKATIKTFTATGGNSAFAFVATRAAGPSADTEYKGGASGNWAWNSSAISKAVAGVQTQLVQDSTITWAVADVMKLESVGATHTLYRNDVPILEAGDAAVLATGRAGVGMLAFGGVVADVELDDWEVGTITTQAASTTEVCGCDNH